MNARSIILVITSTSLVACSTTTYRVTQPTMQTRHPHTHMDLSMRDTISKVVVVPHTDKAEQILFGTYGAPTPSPTVVGIYKARLPIEIAWANVISESPFALPVEIIIPYLVLPFVLYGAVKQGIQNQIQEMRDALADHLTESAGRPVSNMVLAHDLYAEMRTVPGLDANVIAETTPLPEDTDAILLVKLTEIVIEVIEDEAEIETSASAILRRVSDGRTLYSRQYSYTDRDTLRNWTDNDVALWKDYLNFARHYVARQVTADFFEKIELRHDLHPVPTDSVKLVKDNSWQGRAATTSPQLAWKYVRLGQDTYAPSQVAFSEADTFYDLEVYDNHRLVYVARHIPESRHQVDQPLPECRELRWTVRPSFHVDRDVKYGEWMRFYSTVYLNEGYVGSEASQIPAFLRGFAVLRTPCEKT
ncbi:MAG: hypothetical protein P8X81_12935 [Woeseiaceae bacterium]